MSSRILTASLGFVLFLSAMTAAIVAPVAAQSKTTIYRCTDPAGNITLQNGHPCPAGHAQQVRDITAPPTQTTPRAAPPARTPVTVATNKPSPPPAAPVVVSTPQPSQPPPALYQCRTWDDRDYLGDIAEPPSTCAPLQTVGIGGSPDLRAGTACEMRRDTCTAIAAEQLCRAWKRRVDEAEFRWKFAGSGNDERKTEYERISKIYRNSTCMR